MLLGILQCIGQPRQQSVIWSKMLVGLRLRNPGLGGKERLCGREGISLPIPSVFIVWESENPRSTRRIMFKKMILMMMTMAMVILFVHAVVDNGISHSLPL